MLADRLSAFQVSERAGHTPGPMEPPSTQAALVGPPAQGCQGGAFESCPASELRCPQRGVEGALAVDLKVPRLEDPSADGSRWLADCFPTQNVHGGSGHDDLEVDAVEKRAGQ